MTSLVPANAVGMYEAGGSLPSVSRRQPRGIEVAMLSTAHAHAAVVLAAGDVRLFV